MDKQLRSYLETVVTSIINEDTNAASSAFHQYLNAKARTIVEGLRDEDEGMRRKPVDPDFDDVGSGDPDDFGSGSGSGDPDDFGSGSGDPDEFGSGSGSGEPDDFGSGSGSGEPDDFGSTSNDPDFGDDGDDSDVVDITLKPRKRF